VSATSWAQKFVRMPNSTFTAGAPMSAAKAFLVRNNIAHLIDESCQHRVNWALTLDGSGFPADANTWPIITRALDVDKLFYQQEFPLSYLGPNRPANLALAVGIAGVDDTFSEDILARVVICPASSPRDSKQNAIFDEVANGGPSISIESLIDCSEHIATLNGAWQTVGIVNESGTWFGPQACMLRLEVSVSFTTPFDDEPVTTDFVAITVASVLEYG
jgi:hypothetical protein